MKQVITAKLKLHTDTSQFAALRATQLAYRGALNYVSRYAFAHGKKSNQQWLQHETYAEVRAISHLPAQMACNVPRQVGATYKTLWTKVKQNAVARKAGVTRKRYKGLDHPPRYVSPTLTYNYRRDYSLKQGQQVSILTLSGRVLVPYTGYNKHVALLHHGAHIGAAKLWYDKPHKQFYLLVMLELEIEPPTPETHQHVVGVDVGQRYLAGSMAVKVDAYHTSQACPRCGYASPDNRLHKGLLFVCQSCHYCLHADLIGARNIALRTLVSRQDWLATGVLSVHPDGSDAEAKAARRARYAALRWSPGPSPQLKLGGH